MDPNNAANRAIEICFEISMPLGQIAPQRIEVVFKAKLPRWHDDR